MQSESCEAGALTAGVFPVRHFFGNVRYTMVVFAAMFSKQCLPHATVFGTLGIHLSGCAGFTPGFEAIPGG